MVLLRKRKPQQEANHIIEPAEGLEKATFAMGCFWGPDLLFSNLDGVKHVTVGYTGGKKKRPTYRSLGKHSESVRIVYDPEEITYQELLRHFWENQNPTVLRDIQYRSAIFYHNEQQKKVAEESKKKVQESYATEIQTAIEPAGDFWVAEEYHQDYLKKKNGGKVK